MPLRRRTFPQQDMHAVDPEDFAPFDDPDTADVLDQDQPDPLAIKAVPVEVQGTVRVESPPARSGSPYTVVAPLESGGVAVKVLNADPRRELATIVPLDSDLYIGTSMGDVINSPGAARWPAAVPFVWRSGEELWCSAVTVATVVTVVPELWAR